MKRALFIIGSLILISGGIYWYLNSFINKLNLVSFDIGKQIKESNKGFFSIPVIVRVLNQNSKSLTLKNVSIFIYKENELLAQSDKEQTIVISGNQETEIRHDMAINSLNTLSKVLLAPKDTTELTIVVHVRLFLFDFSKTLKQLV